MQSIGGVFLPCPPMAVCTGPGFTSSPLARMESCRQRSGRSGVVFRMVFPALVFFLASVTGHADMYVWRDAQGAMKYSGVSPGGGVRDVRKIKTTVKFQCAFSGSPADCGLHLQAKAQSRASIEKVARDGSTVLRLRTEPGDDHVAWSGDMERTDMYLSQADTGCYEGREQWWEHSILFPDDYVFPSASAKYSSSWNIVFDFHNSASGPWQANFHAEVVTLSPDPNNPLLNPDPPILRFRGYGGEKSGDGEFAAPIGPVVKNAWYEFVYHVQWSSGPDGYFEAWVNGVKKLSHKGPTLYAGQGCYLKLANYHVPYRQASSVIHGHVIRHDVE